MNADQLGIFIGGLLIGAGTVRWAQIIIELWRERRAAKLAKSQGRPTLYKVQ